MGWSVVDDFGLWLNSLFGVQPQAQQTGSIQNNFNPNAGHEVGQTIAQVATIAANAGGVASGVRAAATGAKLAASSVPNAASRAAAAAPWSAFAKSIPTQAAPMITGKSFGLDLATKAIGSAVQAAAFSAPYIYTMRSTWDAYDGLSGSDGAAGESDADSFFIQEKQAKTLEQLALQNEKEKLELQALKDKAANMQPADVDAAGVTNQLQYEKAKQAVLETQKASLELENLKSKAASMEPTSDQAHSDLYSAQAYYYGLMGQQIQAEMDASALKTALLTAGGGGGEAQIFDPFAVSSQSQGDNEDMSMPYRSSGYRRPAYGGSYRNNGYANNRSNGGRVRVGANYVYSSTPRPGFRPAQGGGYYKRRTY